MAKKKLLFVLNSGRYFISHRLSLALCAMQNGFEIHVACPPTDMAEQIEKAGIIYHEIPLSRKGINPLQEIATIIALKKLYRQLNPTIVHHLTVKPVIYGNLAGRGCSLPLVINAIPGLGSVFTDNHLKMKLLRRILKTGYRLMLKKKNSITIFQNSDDMNFFINQKLIHPENAALIKSSGICLQSYPLLPEPTSEQFVVILPARMLWHKGIKYFVEAARQLKDRENHIKMVLVGGEDSGNPSAIHQNQLEAWKKEGVVEWWGFQKNMLTVFSQANLVCLPSYYREGFPKVLLEAAACGRAIITTDVPGCRDAVIHDKTGLMIPPHSSAALVKAIIKLSQDQDKCRQMGQLGRQNVAENYSIEDINQQTLLLYDLSKLITG